MSSTADVLPRWPVLGWSSFGGSRAASTGCILDLPALCYTTSGRASILLALDAVGVGPGDRVLLPTYHCPTMVAPAVELGAVPVFYPIDANGGPLFIRLDEQDLRGVRAMLVPHYFGEPQAMSAVRRWCDANHIALVEDCAHAFFGNSDGRPNGTWGDVSVGSLTKFLPVPEGGCLVLNNGVPPPRLCASGWRAQAKAMLDIVEVGARHGRLGWFGRLMRRSLDAVRRHRPPIEYVATDGGPTIEAGFSIDVALARREMAVACRWVAQGLPRERILERRRHNYRRLAERLSGHTGLRPLRSDVHADCCPYVFPLWVDTPDPGYVELRQSMPVFRWDRLWPTVPVIDGDHGLQWSHHVLQLACHQDLGDEAIDRLASSVVALYAGGNKAGPGA